LFYGTWTKSLIANRMKKRVNKKSIISNRHVQRIIRQIVQNCPSPLANATRRSPCSRIIIAIIISSKFHWKSDIFIIFRHLFLIGNAIFPYAQNKNRRFPVAHNNKIGKFIIFSSAFVARAFRAFFSLVRSSISPYIRVFKANLIVYLFVIKLFKLIVICPKWIVGCTRWRRFSSASGWARNQRRIVDRPKFDLRYQIVTLWSDLSSVFIFGG
jgi:hypothetical protein